MADDQRLQPYISDEKGPREFTLRSLVLAAILTLILGTSSGYLGLKIGMTFAASIPAAVMSLAILRGLFRDANILESNMVQTQASAGEALMGGVVFMIPALIFLELAPSLIQIALMALAGGLLGTFLLIPLRHYFVVAQHGTIPFPEGQACANILKLGEKGATQARRVFEGMAVGGIYNFCSADGLRLFSANVELSFQRFWGLTVGMFLAPLMLGTGFLVGPSGGITMLAGSLLKGIAVIPGLNYGYFHLYNGSLSAGQLDFYVRMIGAGAVGAGGFLSLFKMAAEMRRSFKGGLRGLGRAGRSTDRGRLNRDIPMPLVGTVLVGVLAVSAFVLIQGSPSGEGPGIVGLVVSLVLIFVLGFLFVTLCARLVGFVGTSSYPLSGMTIGALLVTVVTLRIIGLTGAVGMSAAIIVGAIVCMAIAMSADISQDLKTGALLGATPYRQQLGETIGVLIAALTAGSVIMLFHETGELARLPAPQSRLMAAIVEGVMGDGFPWALVGLGVLIAIIVESLGVSSILFAVGLYLPTSLSSAWIVGGLVRGAFDKKHAQSRDKEVLLRDGILLSSGLIAGWALMGIVLVGFLALYEFRLVGFQLGLRDLPSPAFSFSYLLDLAVSMGLYAAVIYYFGRVIRLWGVRP